MTPISYDEWAAALAGATETEGDGLTVTGWAQRLGLSSERTTAWIKAGLAAGFMRRVTVSVEAVTGISRRVCGFCVVPKEGSA